MGTEAVIVAEIAREVAEFTSRHVDLGIILPTGWFGKPYDESRALIGMRHDGARIVLDFSWNLSVVVLSPRIVTTSRTAQHGGRVEERMAIRDFDTLTAGMPGDARREYRSGELVLVAMDWMSESPVGGK